MKSHHSNKSTFRGGFALIATVMIMVLLGLVAIGLLSLSSIALRTSTQESAQMQARANARMALMIAIGELQEQLGPDQRISANASIYSDSTVAHPHWLGVWDAWIAGPTANAAVNDNYPLNESHHQTLGAQSDDSMRPEYDKKFNQSSEEGYFRRWLVSLFPEEGSMITSPADLDLAGMRLPTGEDDAVQLVGEGSLGGSAGPEDHVSARLLQINDRGSGETTGRYGWWVSDHSQKARITDDSYAAESNLTVAEKIFRSQAPASTGTGMIPGLEGINDDAQLAFIASNNTLDLLDGVEGRPAQMNFHTTTPYSYGVPADVREGGLKRDLSILLERVINIDEDGDEFMLYAFDDSRWPGDRSHSRVPLQDLAAYYQMYDDRPDWSHGRRGGIHKSGNTIQTEIPDYGASDRDRYVREYTGLYRQPVPIKVQFLVSAMAREFTEDQRLAWNDWLNSRERFRDGGYEIPPDSGLDYYLMMGITPVLTLWNPNSTTLEVDQRQVFRCNTPPFAFRWKKYQSGGDLTNTFFNLNYAMSGDSTTDGRARRLSPHVIHFDMPPTTFEPGEVKHFSLPADMFTNELRNRVATSRRHIPVNEWDPFGFMRTVNFAVSSRKNGHWPDIIPIPDENGKVHWGNKKANQGILFNANDRLAFQIINEGDGSAGRQVSRMNDTIGSGFNFYMLNRDNVTNAREHFRNWGLIGRYGGSTGVGRENNFLFNGQLIGQGFPEDAIRNPGNNDIVIPFQSPTQAIKGIDLVNAGATDNYITLMEFSMTAGVEAGPVATGGAQGGRRIATRPFLHAATIKPPFIDHNQKEWLYNYGWDWQVNRIDSGSVEDSIIQTDPGSGNGFYGGGYTTEAGTTHVIQQELPVLPPISIAALSHAHLGGFSLADDAVVGEPDEDHGWKSGRIKHPRDGDFEQATTTGQGGLAPHVMQAIGNSYAHPNIPADKAFTTKQRHFDNDADPQTVPFVDHSYLANKALWDDYFFSSIAPQPSKVPFYDRDRSLEDVAREFFFGEEPLPNRRIIPYMANLDEEKLEELLAMSSQASRFGPRVYDFNGLPDRIAAHLMVEGAFNVNSTSVEAWKIFLSSLHGKNSVHLNDGKLPVQDHSSSGVVVNPGMLSNSAPVPKSEIRSPNNPAAQWTGGRELSETEIEELAVAMVKQVKLRGPFLSLSEFINRRLSGSNPELAVKGALQAALDDPDVSINAHFRVKGRILDSEVAGIDFDFPEAAEGPVAYGSHAYIDQADILRGFAGQLTTRGDTFVIRTYGDALDKNGKVEARAWCEAVVQRLPEYVDSADEEYKKQADLTSESNRNFGRKFHVVSFRWLNPAEI